MPVHRYVTSTTLKIFRLQHSIREHHLTWSHTNHRGRFRAVRKDHTLISAGRNVLEHARVTQPRSPVQPADPVLQDVGLVEGRDDVVEQAVSVLHVCSEIGQPNGCGTGNV